MTQLKQLLAVFLSAYLASPLCCCATSLADVAAPDQPVCCHGESVPNPGSEPCSGCECVEKGEAVPPTPVALSDLECRTLDVSDEPGFAENPQSGGARVVFPTLSLPPPPPVSEMFCVLRL